MVLLDPILRLPPSFRRFLLVFIDILLLSLSVWLSFWLRLANPFHLSFQVSGSWMLPAILLLGLPIYALTGLYKGLTRYVGSIAVYRLAYRNGLLVLLLVLVGITFRLPMPPRSSWLLLWLLLTGFTGAIRFIFRDILLSLNSVRKKQTVRVAIYGAGQAGAQLAAALRLGGNHQIITFLDDAPFLWERTLNGTPIQPPQVLHQIYNQIDQVLLAIPSLTRSERRQIVFELRKLSIPVMHIPSVNDLTSGISLINSLRPISIEDLLGRDPVTPDPSLMAPAIRGAVVCVTGAGGSIGSELCRQILKLNPKRLILLEQSEPSLYSIEQELLATEASNVPVQAVLGSTSDSVLLQHLFSTSPVDVVFHAAAYKHVPLVQSNPLSGLSNNVFGTRHVCQAATRCGVPLLIMISSDKAVRPTNIMGASKRLAELILQAFADEQSQLSKTRFAPFTRLAMVRFGNVLGSSGSVVPLFRRQIASGGPITLTHPEIIRFFMTIYESAQLVLQTASLAQGGDVFLLDMGDPVRIKDLAEQMVSLCGLSLRDASNPTGDIEIIHTGLRPGEKLYEELLIDATSEPTQHPLIFRAKEASIPPDELWPLIDDLEDAVFSHDESTALKILSKLVPEWQQNH
ncbi:nucleoside-diphosphate sugar epimerase/dehydratase [Synechococcus sp. UW105]|uniref:polysaccharide biosynthesis protein n=1 Tax=Synechococcus sp. UW105 TaxID=337067 RepID=UPI000E0EAB2E|nr:nucleoside-diphosphate sugar epimerase/dehydratase [Synechococcus sp. UW105]